MYAHELRKWSLANLLLMFLLLPALALAVTMSAGDDRSLSVHQYEHIPVESMHNPPTPPTQNGYGHDRNADRDSLHTLNHIIHSIRHNAKRNRRQIRQRFESDYMRIHQAERRIDDGGHHISHETMGERDARRADRTSDGELGPDSFAVIKDHREIPPHVTRHHHHQNYHHLQQQQSIENHPKPQPQSMPSAMTLRQLSVNGALSGVVPTTPFSLTTSSTTTRNLQHSKSSAVFLPQHQLPHLQQHQRRRFCSARDPKTLAFEAPTVFEGKVKSMSADRRHNFSVTFEVLRRHKEQPQLNLPPLVRLQFEQRNTSGECDIYREQLRPRGFVRELEPGKVYLLFVEQQQGDIGNFSILGQPVKKTRKAVMDVRQGVDERYGQRAFIESLLVNHSSAREGRRVRIVCKVRGQPPPKVTWFKDGRSISRNRNKYQFVYLRKRSELIIRSAMRSDSGQYECRAKNKLARQTVSRVTWVDIAPKENTEVIRVTPNTSIGAPCPHVGDAFCLNGGTCVFFKDVGEPACKCPDGFMGQRCETKNPTNRQSSTYNKKEQQQCGDNKFYGSYYC